MLQLLTIEKRRKLAKNIIGRLFQSSLEIDKELKGKHFKVRATNEILEATGKYSTRAGRKRIELIRDYTIYGDPMYDLLLEGSLEETSHPLTTIERQQRKKIDEPSHPVFDNKLLGKKFTLKDWNDITVEATGYINPAEDLIEVKRPYGNQIKKEWLTKGSLK